MHGFVSYSHADYGMQQTFRAQLRAIEHAFPINFWWDERINAGYRWDATIRQEIDAADVFVLLVSNEFLASDYIRTQEIPAIDARRAANPDVLVLPVILEPCQWGLLIRSLQAVPTSDGYLRPISRWQRRNDGCARAGEQITTSLQSHFGLTPAGQVF